VAALLIANKAVCFGRYPLHNGKTSQYWIDPSALTSGHDEFAIGRVMALTIQHFFGSDVDVLLGAPDSGGGMATIAAQYYALHTGHPTTWGLVNSQGIRVRSLASHHRIVIVDDILATGTNLRAAYTAAAALPAKVSGACVLIDRKDRGKSGRLATVDLEREFSTKVLSCVEATEVVRNLQTAVSAAQG
jgi:orotate phosphoribosyltransferase